MNKRKLGRGLSTLLAGREEADAEEEGLMQIPVESIRPCPWQPRSPLSEEDLRGLADSIARDGLLQPLVVRRIQEGQYELVAGERRWRAARLAGLTSVPSVVRDVPDSQVLELALVENLQRQDLNAIERAKAYRQLIQQLGLTQEDAAKRLGQERSTLANFLRLLELPEEIQQLVSRGTITSGHARAILTLPSIQSQMDLAKRIVSGGLSVRAAESLATSMTGPRTTRQAKAKPAHIRDVEQRLQRALGTRVVVHERRKGGRIIIDFFSHDEFNRLLSVLEGSQPGEAL